MKQNFLNYFKRIIKDIYILFKDLIWRVKIKHHNTTKLSRYFFPFKTNKITYDIPSKKINYRSSLNIYKIKNLYKPASFHTFYSPRLKYFVSEDWIFDIKKQINFKKKNISTENSNLKNVKLSKPVFFIKFTSVYSYFILWNFINILLLKINKIDFVLGIHEDSSNKKKFNKDFLVFFKKYLNCDLINLPSKKNILINSETILFENYSKVGVINEKKTRSDYQILPKEIFTDLPKLITNNKKLKKYFGKPRNDVILLSRKDSRIIANEKDLLSKVPMIKKIIPEELSLEEELSLAYHAKIIISTYGAALSNIFLQGRMKQR